MAKQKPTYAVVTNSTYDGLCYNSVRVEDLLGKSSDRVHIDEAWYGYARFNPMYENHFAMRGDPAKHKGPTVFATHKLLATSCSSTSGENAPERDAECRLREHSGCGHDAARSVRAAGRR